MRQISFYLSFLAVFVSCKSETASDDSKNFKVDFNKEITIKFSELFDSFEIIQLKPFTPIGSLDKLIYTDDHIIVIDQTINKMIHVFSKSGDFISEINNKGNGPSEFKNQVGVNLSKNMEDLYFYCPINKKILIYGLEGGFKSEFNLKDFLSVGDMLLVDDGLVLVDFVQEDYDKKLIFLEDNFKSYQYLKFPKAVGLDFGFEPGKSKFFFQGREGFYYKDLFENSILHFHKDLSIERINIDLGRKSLVLDGKRSYSFQEINDELIKQDAYILADALVDLGGYILMDLHGGDKTQMVLAEKETKKTILVRTLENDMDGIFKEAPFSIFDSPGYFVYPVHYYFLKSLIDLDDKQQREYKNELIKIEDGDAEGIVLLVYKLKPNIGVEF
ncbi:6-bladed beta-propeller [Belliella pelovolcani]|uniref:6-bladed beta-propeller n=1 Tax=Belliella pelovolcani TaxID=529505 RepID=UPI00391C85E7